QGEARRAGRRQPGGRPRPGAPGRGLLPRPRGEPDPLRHQELPRHPPPGAVLAALRHQVGGALRELARRARGSFRGCAVVLGLALLLGLGGLAWLDRDPTAFSLARRAGPITALLESRTSAGGSLVERRTLRSAAGLAVELAVKRPAEALPVRRPLV